MNNGILLWRSTRLGSGTGTGVELCRKCGHHHCQWGFDCSGGIGRIADRWAATSCTIVSIMAFHPQSRKVRAAASVCAVYDGSLADLLWYVQYTNCLFNGRWSFLHSFFVGDRADEPIAHI